MDRYAADDNAYHIWLYEQVGRRMIWQPPLLAGAELQRCYRDGLPYRTGAQNRWLFDAPQLGPLRDRVHGVYESPRVKRVGRYSSNLSDYVRENRLKAPFESDGSGRHLASARAAMSMWDLHRDPSLSKALGAAADLSEAAGQLSLAWEQGVGPGALGPKALKTLGLPGPASALERGVGETGWTRGLKGVGRLAGPLQWVAVAYPAHQAFTGRPSAAKNRALLQSVAWGTPIWWATGPIAQWAIPAARRSRLTPYAGSDPRAVSSIQSGIIGTTTFLQRVYPQDRAVQRSLGSLSTEPIVVSRWVTAIPRPVLLAWRDRTNLDRFLESVGGASFDYLYAAKRLAALLERANPQGHPGDGVRRDPRWGHLPPRVLGTRTTKSRRGYVEVTSAPQGITADSNTKRHSGRHWHHSVANKSSQRTNVQAVAWARAHGLYTPPALSGTWKGATPSGGVPTAASTNAGSTSSTASVPPWVRYGMTKAQWLAWAASKKGR